MDLNSPSRILGLTEYVLKCSKATIYSQNTHRVLLHQDVRILIQIDAESFNEGVPSGINVILKNYNKENRDIWTQKHRRKWSKTKTLTFLNSQHVTPVSTKQHQNYPFGPDLYGLDFISSSEMILKKRYISHSECMIKMTGSFQWYQYSQVKWVELCKGCI